MNSFAIDYYTEKPKRNKNTNRRKRMIPNIIENIVQNVANNQRGGIIGFVASLFVSILPSYSQGSMLAQIQPSDYLFTADLIVKAIQIIAGLLGIVLSAILIYINAPKFMKTFNRNKKARKIRRK
jgi:hypothetical protein